MKRIAQLFRDLRRDLATVAENSARLADMPGILGALEKSNARLRTLTDRLDRIEANTARPLPRPSVWLDTPPNSNAALFKALSEAALARTVEIVRDEMAQAILFQSTEKFHRHCLNRAPRDGAHCEFGVYSGQTINQFARWRPDIEFIGFDSFEGLPGEWTGWQNFDFATGGTPPEVEPNVRLEIGLFSDTLPRVAPTLGTVGFLHVDCDLYSSTAEIFAHLGDKLAHGCVILFDEYFCYPGFEQHEFRAFAEFLAGSGRTATWFALCGQRAACVLT